MDQVPSQLPPAPHALSGRTARLLTIGGAAAVLVLVAVLLGGMLSARKLLGRGVRKVTAVVLRELPAGMTASRREEVSRRLECVAWAAETGTLDEARLGAFVRRCRAAAAGRRIDPAQLREIETEAIALCIAAGGDIR